MRTNSSNVGPLIISGHAPSQRNDGGWMLHYTITPEGNSCDLYSDAKTQNYFVNQARLDCMEERTPKWEG